MVGMIVASHGPLAQGILETSKWFFGDQEQFEALCLEPGQELEDYDVKMQEAIERVDTGDGVILFVDLLFGTPCNRAALSLQDNVEVITGVNLGVILEMLGSREYFEGGLKELTFSMVQTAKNAVTDLKKVLEEMGD